MKLHLEKIASHSLTEYPYNFRVTVLDYEQGELNQMHQWLEENNLPYIPVSNRIWLREKNVSWFMMRWS